MDKAKLRTVAQLQEFLDETQEINPGSGQYAHRLSLERVHFFTLAA